MPSFVKSVTFDCHDPLDRRRVLGPRPRLERRRGQHTGPRVGGAPGELDAECDRLVGLGAHVVGRHGDLVVMTDPEGNEFCLEA